MTAGITAILLATSVGSTDVLGQERRKRQRVRPAAATVTVQDSNAIVQALGFDGAGTLHNKVKEDEHPFTLSDQIVRFNDTDDAPRGAAAKTEQLTTIGDDGTTAVVKTRSEGNARYYDRRPSDSTQPDAEANASLFVRVDVGGGAGDKGFFSLRGSIHGEASGGGSSGCAQVEVTAPDGTIIQGGGSCVGSFTIPIDESGPLDPGSYILQVESAAETNPTFPISRAKTSWNLELVLSGCDIVGTTGDDPNLDGTTGDDVICGLAGNDTIDAGDGADTVFGGADADTIDGGPEADTIFGLGGNDIIRGEGGRDQLFGGADKDDIFDHRGPNTIDGGDELDFICGSPQRDVIDGGPGFDVIRGRGGPDKIDGGPGDDRIFGDHGPAACPAPDPVGTSQRDEIDGGAGDDEIFGGPDRDTIRGAGGRDRLLGQGDNDTLNACDGARDQAVSGGPGGNDVVRRDNVDPSNGNEVRRPC